MAMFEKTVGTDYERVADYGDFEKAQNQATDGMMYVHFADADVQPQNTEPGAIITKNQIAGIKKEGKYTYIRGSKVIKVVMW